MFLFQQTYNYDIPVDEQDEIVTIEVQFEPLLLDTMSSMEQEGTVSHICRYDIYFLLETLC